MLFGLPFGKMYSLISLISYFFGENTEIVLPNLEDILIYVMLRKHLIFYIIYSGLIRQFIPNPSFSFLLVSLLGTRHGLVYFKTMRIIH